MFENWYDQHKEKNLNIFFKLLQFASISTDPHYENELRGCADWLHHLLQDIGLQVEVWGNETKGPTLFAHDLRAGKEKETLLLYCHYDVQPIDPLEEWDSPPFSPEVRENVIYARGASDNKGQLFYTLLAIKSYLSLHGALPFNLKFLIEGGEESGSKLLNQLVKEKSKELQADHLLIVDSGFSELEQPAISIGYRGIVCLGVTLKEANFDLHSGQHGGIAYNPNRALVELLASFYDHTGKVALEGFYDGITTLDETTKEKLSFQFDERKFSKEFGFTPWQKNPLQAAWLSPTLEINGIAGGYAGKGFKTVIPSEAHAKISCRVAPGQDPHHLLQLVEEHLQKNAPKGMRMTIERLSKPEPGVLSHPNEKIVQVMQKAYEKVFQKPIDLIMMGGSIPIGYALREAAGARLVLVGVALGTDRIHAPNEHFDVERIKLGFLTLVNAFDLLR